MSDSFFAAPRKQKRTNRNVKEPKSNNISRKRRRPTQEESDVSDEEGPGLVDDLNLNAAGSESSEEEEIKESAAEKRIRLAKAYLDKIQVEAEEADGFDAADLDRDLIAERLRQDEDEALGKLNRRVADLFHFKDYPIHKCRGHQLPVTAVALLENGTAFYTASKDGSIVKWDAKTFTKLHTFPGGRKGATDFIGHTDHIFCLAVSSDNQYLASGGKDKLIQIWSVKDNTHIVTFKQHRDAVSGLAFRKGSNQLYSASHDRTIKLWNVDERAYIETLFGHQDVITGIDTLGRERCVTTGGRDKTARVWKIVEESQLVYRGGVTTAEGVEGSLDCIAQVEENTFITGGDSGSLSMWNLTRKKPIFILGGAHGTTSSGPRWITALASLRYSDVFVSGSSDGFVRVWKIAADNMSFSALAQIPVPGFINSLQIKTITPSNKTLLVIGVGQEPRLGRWMRIKDGVKNCTIVVELST